MVFHFFLNSSDRVQILVSINTNSLLTVGTLLDTKAGSSLHNKGSSIRDRKRPSNQLDSTFPNANQETFIVEGIVLLFVGTRDLCI